MKYRCYNKIITVKNNKIRFTERIILQHGVVLTMAGDVLPGIGMPEYVVDAMYVEDDNQMQRLYEHINHIEVDGAKMNRICLNSYNNKE